MIKAQLFAMGTQRELLSTQLTYYRTANPKTGRSGPIPMGGLVTLAFTSGDGDDRLLRWITHSPKGELCTLTVAKIVFYEGDLDGSALFEYQLHDAALVHWKEEFKATGTTPMTVTMTISAAIQTIKGITWIKPWRESRVLSEEIATHKEEVQRGVSDDRGKKENGSALEGVVLERAEGVTNAIPKGKLANHLFKGTGKLVDNPANRSLITKISNGKLLIVDKFGKSWYRGVDASGRGIYSYTQNGVVKGTGYTNLSAAEIIAKYGVK